ncbi:hypothetical protein HW260_06005 [Helicobacter cinaedi]|nr:hypothetical protein [Helicobacter cinaedi]QOQ89848.1 hypothetical protein HW260_06005 [Helicobacter cinaedi]
MPKLNSTLCTCTLNASPPRYTTISMNLLTGNLENLDSLNSLRFVGI